MIRFKRYQILTFLSFALLVIGCGNSDSVVNKKAWEGWLKCDAESDAGSWLRTTQSNIHLRGMHLIERNKSLSGDQSVKLCFEHIQGFAFEITETQYLDQVTVRVWRNKMGHESDLLISDKNGHYEYAMPTGNENGNWEELEVKFNRFNLSESDTLLVQCKFSGTRTDTAWFDDFSCEVKSFTNQIPIQVSSEEEVFSIELPSESYQKIKAKRIKALQIGLLIKESSDLVQASIYDSIPVKLRLKGDWTDHLLGNKWSLRIEVEHSDNNVNGWKGMQKFSIQSPLSRNMLNEYVFHQLLADEGVLTPSYQFLPTQLNGEMIGIMAIEGHFTPELLTQQNRHPGPILKFNENHLWDMRAKKIEHISEYPTVEAAEVKVFSKRTYRSDTALALVERGRSLLYAHQQNLAPLDSLFNVDLLAKYFAICEVIGAAHSYLWHNTRYYYNERVDRLEPIGFDGNPSINPNVSDFHLLPTFKKPFIREKRVVNLVSSVNFQKAFIAYLRKFSSEAYLLEFFSKHAMELKKQESILQREYPQYVFPRAALFYRASKIQTMYSDWKLSTVQCRSASFVSVDHSVVPFPGISVVAYKKKLANEFVQIDVLNYFNEEFTIVSVHNANNTKRIESKKVLAPFNSPDQPDRISLVIPFSPTHVTVHFNSLDQEYEVKISKYQFPNILN